MEQIGETVTTVYRHQPMGQGHNNTRVLSSYAFSSPKKISKIQSSSRSHTILMAIYPG